MDLVDKVACEIQDKTTTEQLVKVFLDNNFITSTISAIEVSCQTNQWLKCIKWSKIKNQFWECQSLKSSKRLNILQKYKDVTGKYTSDNNPSCLKSTAERSRSGGRMMTCNKDEQGQR
ncbi:Hypothetical predicted protein [Mytilus galloprovincialis]|uniref:Uncharacterized protein n=1 Tax=Mytilus galloprovincialis TaxID=29158 RepID=A0A8B6G953_MYTGA|nr:Hypothetical predicted protein [Mytilus galloprovincialis]